MFRLYACSFMFMSAFVDIQVRIDEVYDCYIMDLIHSVHIFSFPTICPFLFPKHDHICAFVT